MDNCIENTTQLRTKLIKYLKSTGIKWTHMKCSTSICWHSLLPLAWVAETVVTSSSATHFDWAHAQVTRLLEVRRLFHSKVHLLNIRLYTGQCTCWPTGFHVTTSFLHAFQRIQQRCYTHSDTGTAALLHEKASNTCGKNKRCSLELSLCYVRCPDLHLFNLCVLYLALLPAAQEPHLQDSPASRIPLPPHFKWQKAFLAFLQRGPEPNWSTHPLLNLVCGNHSAWHGLLICWFHSL